MRAGEIALAAIPVIGGPLSAAFTALDLAAINRRLDLFAQELQGLAARMNADLADQELIHSEAFEDATLTAVDVSRHTSDRSKLRMIAGVLLGAAFVGPPERPDLQEVLTALGQLSPASLQLMRQIHDQVAEAKFVLPGVSAINPPEVPDREFLLKRLEAAGFISEVGGARLDYEGGAYTETETYRKVLRLLGAVGA
jgi:hypothetical protein